MTRWILAAATLGLLTACDGGAAKPDGAAPAEPAKAAKAPAKPETAEPAVSEAPSSEPAEVANLGAARIDPPWFKTSMLGEGANMVNSARSEADDAGRFKSHMVFELPEGTSIEDCAKQTTDAVGSAVELSQEKQPDGRIKLTGSTGTYAVTSMCGEAKGTMRAYVAYEWTQ
ncbi:MAG: hypothetical protein AAGA54_04365 [Myxococcota bacterium]